MFYTFRDFGDQTFVSKGECSRQNRRMNLCLLSYSEFWQDFTPWDWCFDLICRDHVVILRFSQRSSNVTGNNNWDNFIRFLSSIFLHLFPVLNLFPDGYANEIILRFRPRLKLSLSLAQCPSKGDRFLVLKFILDPSPTPRKRFRVSPTFESVSLVCAAMSREYEYYTLQRAISRV